MSSLALLAFASIAFTGLGSAAPVIPQARQPTLEVLDVPFDDYNNRRVASNTVPKSAPINIISPAGTVARVRGAIAPVGHGVAIGSRDDDLSSLFETATEERSVDRHRHYPSSDYPSSSESDKSPPTGIIGNLANGVATGVSQTRKYADGNAQVNSLVSTVHAFCPNELP